ncbi:methylmalonyl-CoA epimerase [Bacillus carboniphilus]|uniref:Methylmalonyl-CoA epimerase n=1 Tax=Bacillus carboniphilus TaxID=86663 RepID=A0ABY9JYK0_9BACI|nr:methylmalonyl-CoA epimerase [Bacillus carboniphilus]WLR43859.1 methylmalonyl-CoA epimerase [Bacillus carboniphilus]
MVNKVDHIGIAVRSIKETLPIYLNVFGLTLIDEEVVESQQVKVAFIDAGNIKLELLEPLSTASPVASFIEKRGEGIHHVAFGVDDIENRIKHLVDKDIQMIDHTSRTGAGGADIAFMHPKSTKGVLFELCEKRGK